MEEVKNWLDMENPDFDQGFTIFSKYSKSISLINYIQRKKALDTLKYQMEKLIAAGGTLKPNLRHCNSMPAKKSEESKTIVIDTRKMNREDLPEDMQAVYDTIVDHYKEMRIVHEKMKLANSISGRAEFRDKLTKLEEKVKKGWQIIDSGKFPQTDKSISSNINSARAYISKMLKKQELTAQQREMVKEKLNIIITSGEQIKPETVEKLKEKGFQPFS